MERQYPTLLGTPYWLAPLAHLSCPFEGVQRVKSQVKIAVRFSEKMARLEILSVFSQVAEARIGRLSSSQREFTTIRSKKNSLIELDKKRNGEEDPLLRRLQTKLFHSKRNMSDYDDRLLIKPKSSAKSVAERVTTSRAYESFSDVGEIRVWFASKFLTPCRMH